MTGEYLRSIDAVINRCRDAPPPGVCPCIITCTLSVAGNCDLLLTNRTWQKR